MAKKKTTPAVKSEIVDTDIKIGNEEILAIVVSRAETRLKTEIDDCRKTVRRLKEDKKNAEEAAATEARKFANSQFKKEITTLKKATASGLLGAVEVERDHSLHPNGRRSGRDKPVLIVVINFTTGSAYKGNIRKEHEFPIPSNVQKHLDAAKRAEEVIKEGNEAIASLKKQVSNIPMLERQARARLAERRLGQSEDGKALLAALTDELEQEILALPCG